MSIPCLSTFCCNPCCSLTQQLQKHDCTCTCVRPTDWINTLVDLLYTRVHVSHVHAPQVTQVADQSQSQFGVLWLTECILYIFVP